MRRKPLTQEEREQIRLRDPSLPFPNHRMKDFIGYPGLQPYLNPDLFSGRDADIIELERHLFTNQEYLIGIIGRSGVGKSSFLLAGLIPKIVSQGHRVAYDQRPDEPYLADRIFGQLLDGLPKINDNDPNQLIETLEVLESLCGTDSPILVLDQFERVLTSANTEEARARTGVLLAATVRPGGVWHPPCQWIISFREEHRPEVERWFRDDILSSARQQTWAERLTHFDHKIDLADRLNIYALPPQGTPGRGLDSEWDRIVASRTVFEQAISPESMVGQCDSPWFCEDQDYLRQLARVFADARENDSDAALVPELQIVLANLVNLAGTETTRTMDPESQVLRLLGFHIHEVVKSLAQRHGKTWEDDIWRALYHLAKVYELRDSVRLEENELAYFIDANRPKWSFQVLANLAENSSRILERCIIVNRVYYSFPSALMAKSVVQLVETKGASSSLSSEKAVWRTIIDTERARASEAGAISRATAVSWSEFLGHLRSKRFSDNHPELWKAIKKRKRKQLNLVTSATLTALLFLILALSIGPRFFTSEPTAGYRSPAHLSKLAEDLGDLQRAAGLLDHLELNMPDPSARPEELADLGLALWIADWAGHSHHSLANRAAALRRRLLVPLSAIRTPNISSFDWVRIEGGSFRMGQAASGSGIGEANAGGKEVSVDSYWILRHEVTNAEYRQLIANHRVANNEPVVEVSWYEAYLFSAWLGGRLPSEAEWEYSARADCRFKSRLVENSYTSDDGTNELRLEEVLFHCTSDGRYMPLSDTGWYLANSGRRIHPVMTLEANPWGIHDMFGNVSEWVMDWHGVLGDLCSQNPWGPPGGKQRVYRGGSYLGFEMWARPRHRDWISPDTRDKSIGFRPVRPIPIPQEAKGAGVTE